MESATTHIDGSNKTLRLGEILAAVSKNRILVAVVVGICLGLTALLTSSQRRIFEANATVYFDPLPPQPLGEKVQPIVNTQSDYWDRRELYNTQYWILTSRAVLEPVVIRLRLNYDAGFVTNLPTSDVRLKAEVPVDKAVEILAARMSVKPVKESRLARVNYRDANAARAQRVIAAVVDVYLQQHEAEVISATSEASTWLHQQLVSLREELENSEMELHKFKRERDLLSVSLDDQSSMLREELSRINIALTDARAKRQAVAARAQQLASVRDDSPEELPARELLESHVLQDLRTAYVKKTQEKLSLIGKGRGERHPEVLGAEAEVSTARAALLAEISNIKRALDKDVRAMDSEIGGLQSMYEKARAHAQEVNRQEIDFKRLKRTRDTNEQLLTVVTERSKESDLSRMLRPHDVRVVEAATLPRIPVSPNVPLNMLVGSVFGLLLGVAAAAGKEALDRTVRQPEDAEALLPFPVLGTLPGTSQPGSYGQVLQLRHRRKTATQERPVEFFSHDNPTSAFSEATRAVRTSIMFSFTDLKLRRLLVTSANAGEGKTTVACNLATAFAQTEKKVLLVDCDLRRPRVHKVFGIDNSSGGVTGLVLNPANIQNCVKETHIKNLWVLTSGVLPPNPSELFHSKTFQEALESVGAQFDLLVIDSPPLVPVTDGAVLAPQTDGVVLVLRANETSRATALRASQLLRAVGAKTVGSVLNAFSPNRASSNPYYYNYNANS